jgi:nucleotide-binding universal stress UspA family protein
MYKHILIGTDGSQLGDKALAHGLALAKTVGAQVTVVTATEPWSAFDMAMEAHKHNPNPVLQFEAMAADAAKPILAAAIAKAKAAGVASQVVHVPNRHAAEAIIETAEKTGADLIVMGSHGRRGINRLILGAQAYEVLSRCKVPALIVR